MNDDFGRLMALLKRRRSCRDFEPENLDESLLKLLGQAFDQSPTAGGRRDLACEFISDRARIKSLADLASQAFDRLTDHFPSSFVAEEMKRYGKNFFWFHQAPCLAVITCRKPPTFLDEFAGPKAPLLWGGEMSAAMAAMALLLAAESLKIGACCLSGPLSVWREVEKELGVSPQKELVLLIALGWMKERKAGGDQGLFPDELHRQQRLSAEHCPIRGSAEPVDQ